MSLYEALLLLTAIADEGAEVYQEEYNDGTVSKALEKVGTFIHFISEE